MVTSSSKIYVDHEETCLCRENFQNEIVLVFFWNYSQAYNLKKIEFIEYLNKKYKNFGLEIIGVYKPRFDFENEESIYKKKLENLGSKFFIYKDYECIDLKEYFGYDFLIFNSDCELKYIFKNQSLTCVEKLVKKLLIDNGLVFFKENEDIVNLETNRPYHELLFALDNVKEYQKGINEAVETFFEKPEIISKNRIYFEGVWEFRKDRAVLKRKNGKIIFSCFASEVYLTAGAKFDVKTSILLNENRLNLLNKGEDINDFGYVNINEYRVYNVFNSKLGKEMLTCEIDFNQENIEIFSISYS